MILHTYKAEITYILNKELVSITFMGQDTDKEKAKEKAKTKRMVFEQSLPIPEDIEIENYSESYRAEELPQYVIDFFTSDIVKPKDCI